MHNKIIKRCLIFMFFIFLVGLVILFSSVTIGRNIALDLLISNGGMNTNEYHIIILSNIETFRALGIVISLLGGLGILLSGYVLYSKIDNTLNEKL